MRISTAGFSFVLAVGLTMLALLAINDSRGSALVEREHGAAAVLEVDACADDEALSPQPIDSTLRDRLNRRMKELERDGHLVSCGDLPMLPGTALPALRASSENTALDGPSLARRLREATVMFHTGYKCDRCDNWHGGVATGFVLHPDGWIVTAAHVIANRPDDHAMAVMTHDERTFAVTGVYLRDDDNDVAIVKIDAANLPAALPLALREPAAGSGVAVMSHPRGFYYLFTRGVVSRVQGGSDGSKRLTITAEFARGSSGAPVVNEQGEVVGIALATTTLHADEAEKTNTQFVLKHAAGVSDLRELIERRRTAGE